MSNSTGYSISDAYSCTEVTPNCPVTATTYGYFPNLGVNIFLAVGFGLSAISTIFFSIWKRTWSYAIGITAGCLLECAGYIGRVLMHHNPWDLDSFKVQIISIVLGPTLFCISIYLTLKHLCLALNPALSPISPKFYPFIFVPADMSCLVIQALGGILADAAGINNWSLLDAGNHIIITGICLQVIVLATFGLTCGFYLVRVRRWLRRADATDSARELWGGRRFRMFLYAVTGAYSSILIRCIYRIAEMAGGWGNHIMQNQPSFVVLESFMILIAAVLLAFFPPGVLFPQIAENSTLRLPKLKSHQRSGRESGHEPKERNGQDP